jgi:hypothetical protein
LQVVKSKKYILLIASVMLLAAGAAGWLMTRHYLAPSAGLKQPLMELKGEDHWGKDNAAGGAEGAVPVKIFSPSPEGVSVIEATISDAPLPTKMAEAVVVEYLKRLYEGQASVKLLGIYRDRRNILYIDFSDELRRRFSGDAQQEYALLSSLFETIVANIVGIEDVRILIEGKEVESIGGHFTILSPLKETIKGENSSPAPAAPQQNG